MVDVASELGQARKVAAAAVTEVKETTEMGERVGEGRVVLFAQRVEAAEVRAIALTKVGEVEVMVEVMVDVMAEVTVVGREVVEEGATVAKMVAAGKDAAEVVTMAM